MERKKIMVAAVIALAAYLALALFGPVALGSTAEGETFVIQVNIADVQDLYGFDFELHYNTASLDLREASPSPPWSLSAIIKNEINEPLGVYRIVAIAMAPSSPFEGSAPLVRLTFLRTSEGEEAFNLANIDLADPSGGAIPYVVNGLTIQAIAVHDIAIARISAYPRGVYQGEPITVSVTIRNQGNFKETFDVSLYADGDKTVFGDEYFIGVQTVTDLPGKTSQTIRFVWDTHDVSYGYYWLSAEATVVAGETDTEDNLLKFGDWIGGIYAPPYVRQLTNFWVNVTSTLIMVSLTVVGTFGIKNYWFP